jgi:type VI secretion system protein ImpK
MTNTPSLAAPSLFGDGSVGTPTPKIDMAERQANTFVDLLYDGFYMLFLLRKRNPPKDAQLFRTSINLTITAFKKNALKMGASAEDIEYAQYAFCATVDELILSSQFNIRDEWQRQPLQLVFFGEQLAGENFFVKLEELRNQGNKRIHALEVFYICLLLGFQGKYMIEGEEKLSFLVARLGEEIAHHKGKRSQFSPRGAIPDQIKHALQHDIPLWVIGTAFVVFALLGYAGFAWLLSSNTNQTLLGYQNVVQLAPRAANITITLP